MSKPKPETVERARAELDALTWNELESSNIKRVAFEETGQQRGILLVEFTTGAIYQYSDCPSEYLAALGVDVDTALAAEARRQRIAETVEASRAPDVSTSRKYMTPADVATATQLSEATVMRWIKAGDLEASKLARRGGWRITPAALERFIAARSNQPPRRRRRQARSATARRNGYRPPLD